LGTAAVVRYASPAFWRYADLEAAHYRRQVTTATGFVSPGTLGHHMVWTYQSPGVYGRANPNGRPTISQDAEGLINSIRSLQARDSNNLPAQPADAVFLHLQQLGTAAEHRQPRLRAMLKTWEENIARSGIVLSERTGIAARSVAAITTLLAPSGVWFLTGQPRTS
jgi:hypothetical protein